MKNKLNNSILIMCFALVLIFCLIQPVFATGARRSVTVACTSDAVCDDGLWCNGRETCDPSSPLADSLGCAPGTWPSVPSGGRCDEDADRVLSWCDVHGDADGDGHDSLDCGGDDCNDHDAQSYPGNTEVCDDHGHDEDCDPTTVGREDLDHDGYNSSKCYNIQADGSRKYDTEHH